MATDIRCWWQNYYVGDRTIMLATFSLCWRFYVLNRSPTSQSCHRNISSPTSVTNIDVSGWFWPKKKNFCHQIFTTRFCHQNFVINIKKSHSTITFFKTDSFKKQSFLMKNFCILPIFFQDCFLDIIFFAHSRWNVTMNIELILMRHICTKMIKICD